jgi:hypothetical protein
VEASIEIFLKTLRSRIGGEADQISDIDLTKLEIQIASCGRVEPPTAHSRQVSPALI